MSFYSCIIDQIIKQNLLINDFKKKNGVGLRFKVYC